MAVLKSFSYFILVIFLIVSNVSCGLIEMIPHERSDDEQAADVMINNRSLSNFKRGFKTIDNTQFIVIKLEKSFPMDNEKSRLTLTYNRELRKWQAVKSIYKYNGYSAKAENTLSENLKPNSSWLDLLNALADHNILNLPGKAMKESVAMEADSAAFLLQVRVADRYKEIAMSDLENVDFREIVKVMDDAFTKSLSQR